MSNVPPAVFISRRTALAGLGAGELGVALAARGTSAQDATAMADYPMVGMWVVVRDVTVDTDAPSIVVYSADGGLIDPSQGVAGTWQATGPRSAAWTLIDILPDGSSGCVAVRSTGKIDEGDDDTLDAPYSFTVIGADGTVMVSGEGMSCDTRLMVEPIDAGGTAPPGFPVWAPAPPADATPTP